MILRFIARLAIILFLFASCSNPKPDDSTTKFQVSSQNKQHYEQLYPPDGTAPKLVDDSVAVIKPTWGQAIYYANKSGNTKGVILGVFCILVFIGTIYMFTRINGWAQGLGTSALLLAASGFALYGFFGKAQDVRLNNTKEIDINFYRNHVALDSSSIGVWDQLYDDNLLIGAASK